MPRLLKFTDAVVERLKILNFCGFTVREIALVLSREFAPDFTELSIRNIIFKLGISSFSRNCGSIDSVSPEVERELERLRGSEGLSFKRIKTELVSKFGFSPERPSYVCNRLGVRKGIVPPEITQDIADFIDAILPTVETLTDIETAIARNFKVWIAPRRIQNHLYFKHGGPDVDLNSVEAAA